MKILFWAAVLVALLAFATWVSGHAQGAIVIVVAGLSFVAAYGPPILRMLGINIQADAPPPAPTDSSPKPTLHQYVASLNTKTDNRYPVLLQALKDAYDDLPASRYDDCLAASIAAVNGFNKAIAALEDPRAPFAAKIDHKERMTLFNALSAPFAPLNGIYSHSDSGRSKYDNTSYSSIDPRAGLTFQENFIKEYGIEDYLVLNGVSQTPFQPKWKEIADIIFDVGKAISLPDAHRFQHTWVIAPTGTGKTNLLEQLIVRDLPNVMAGRASLFIMDSQNELIPRIASQVPREKLVYLEPDERLPLALNIFDNETIDYSSSLELADFVIAGLLGADLTAKQKGVFRYLAEAMQVIPNATIHTFKDLLKKDGYEQYRPYLQRLDPYVREFFEERFNTQSFNSTKEEIFWRLDTILSNRAFRKMFSHARNRINLYDELGQGKVVCVNTNLAVLKPEGTEIMGRFFLAMLLQATERRMLLPAAQRLPVYAYIDECQDYIADEPMMAMFLDKARKQKVAFTLANQRTQNIKSSDVLDALANVNTKFAAKNRTDAAFLAKLMKMEAEELADLPKWHFAYFDGSKPLTVGVQESKLAIDAERMREHRRNMRERYCAPPEQPESYQDADWRPAQPEDRRHTPKPITIEGTIVRSSRRLPKPPEGDDIDISPSKDW